MIRVCISDTHLMGCELLASALNRSKRFSVVATCMDRRKSVECAVQHSPDVALVSTNLGDGIASGYSLLRDLQIIERPPRVVMLVDNDSREEIIDAFRGGARGIVRRRDPLGMLERCITAVHGGQVWASTQDVLTLVEALQSAMPLKVVSTTGRQLLTPRELQIVPLVADGFTNREIAEKLRVTEHTVKNHLFHIYDKLGISSRVELILYAVNPARSVSVVSEITRSRTA